METIFRHAVGSQRGSARYEAPGSYEAFIAEKIDDAVDFERSYLQWEREINLQYFYGQLPAIPAEDDDGNPVSRSTVVSSDIRDTIMSILPSLVRIFLGNEYPVYYTPNSEETEEAAKMTTDYVHHLFRHDWQGFLLLYTVFKDCLINRCGVVQCYTERFREAHEQTFQNITQEQLQAVIYENPTVEIVDQGETDPNSGLMKSVTLHWEVDQPMTKMRNVKPEDFRISRYATSAKTADLIGAQWMVPVSDFVKEGYHPDELMDYMGNDTSPSNEAMIREPAIGDRWTQQDGVLRGEYFIRVDGDGDGIDELRFIKTIGDNHYILEDYPVERSNFAVFISDIRPHTAQGEAISDLGKDIQRIKTNVIRATMDNMVEIVNPKTVINELLTNVEDALNDEVGAVIRTRGDPNNAVVFSRPPFIGEETTFVLNYMDQVRASRTGITEASKGLDPSAMQSTALSGIQAIVQGAQERIELIAYTLCETGVRDLFEIALREVVNNPNPPRQMKLCGQWKYIDPSTFDPNMSVETNPTLGKGSDMVRLQALNSIKAAQEAIFEKFGVQNNPVVTPNEYLNTLEDMLNLVNIKNFGRYFKRIPPEVQQQIDATPKEPSPEEVLAKSQMEDVKRKTVEAIANKDNKQATLAFQEKKLAVDDDFRRDKLNVDAATAVLQATQGIQEQADAQKTLEAENKPNA